MKLDFMAPKRLGRGNMNLAKYVSALTDIDYDNCTCIEMEDCVFEGSKGKSWIH